MACLKQPPGESARYRFTMSENGWRDFLSAEGVEDWVVLHGGPTAVFRVGSLVEAAQLAEAVAAVPGLEERTAMSRRAITSPFG
jgi:hypothetical protein